LIVVGPSGSGKGTLIKRLTDRYRHLFEFSVSYTTRDPRDGELNGVHYNFISKDDFEIDIKSGNFIEFASYADNYYGTNKKGVKSIMEKGKICIMEIDLQGAEKIFTSGFQANFIFILPPSVEALRDRLQGRGTENAEKIEKRLNIAIQEMEEAPKKNFFTAKIVNDDLDNAYGDLTDLIKTLYPSLIF